MFSLSPALPDHPAAPSSPQSTASSTDAAGCFLLDRVEPLGCVLVPSARPAAALHRIARMVDVPAVRWVPDADLL